MSGGLSYASTALTRLGAAFVSLGAIRDSYEIGPVLKEKIGAAMDSILGAANCWPGVGMSVESIDAWIKRTAVSGVLDKDRPGTMAALANTASQAIADLYDMRQTRTRGMRRVLDPIVVAIDSIVDDVSGGREAQWRACEVAEIASGNLVDVIGVTA